MKEYYVYRHIRLDTNTPFYVGKGNGRRASTKYGRSNFWNNITTKYGYRVEIFYYTQNEMEAFKKEIEFIKLYKSLGYCEANFTEGGEGVSGFKFSEESKIRLSEGKKGINNPFYGKKHTPESLEKISETSIGRIHTDESKKKMSKPGSSNPFYGKTHSEELMESIAEKLSKFIYVGPNGKHYKSALSASKDFEIDRRKIARQAKRNRDGWSRLEKRNG